MKNMKNILTTFAVAAIITVCISAKASAATTYTFSNPFTGAVTITVGGRFTTSDKKAFIIRYEGIPQEACIDLAVQDWGATSGSGLIAMGVNKAVTGKTNGCTDKTGGYICGGMGPMPVSEAANACAEGTGNYIEWKFY